MLDSKIPKISTQLALKKLHNISFGDAVPSDAFDKASVSGLWNLRVPRTLSGAAERMAPYGVSLRYSVVSVDPITGQQQHEYGRVYEPSACELSFGTCPTENYISMTLAPISAPLASSVIDKNVFTATGSLGALFPNGDQKLTITSSVRADIRSAINGKYNVERLLWRLAVLYLTCAWADCNDRQLVSTQPMDELAPHTHVDSLTTYTGALQNILSTKINAVCIVCEGMGPHAADMVAMLRLAASREFHFNVGLPLPMLVNSLPSLGNVRVYSFGDLHNPSQPVILNKHTVWEAAVMYSRQHAVFDEFQSMIASVAALWVSPFKAPIFGTDKIALRMPVFSSQSTFILPLSSNYTDWSMGDVDCPQPPAAETFLNGAVASAALGCAVRSWAAYGGAAVCVIMSRAATWLAQMQTGFGAYSGAWTRCMWQAVNILRKMGVEGHIGRVLSTATPRFGSTEDITRWWSAHSVAYQWDEVVPMLDAVPDHCAFAGFVDPLVADTLPVVNRWYSATNLAKGGSIALAMQRVLHAGDIECGVAVTSAASGGRTIHGYPLSRNYCGRVSDWLFFPRFDKDGARAELVFRVVTPAAAVTLHHGTVGMLEREHYIADVVDDGLTTEWEDEYDAGGWNPTGGEFYSAAGGQPPGPVNPGAPHGGPGMGSLLQKPAYEPEDEESGDELSKQLLAAGEMEALRGAAAQPTAPMSKSIKVDFRTLPPSELEEKEDIPESAVQVRGAVKKIEQVSAPVVIKEAPVVRPPPTTNANRSAYMKAKVAEDSLSKNTGKMNVDNLMSKHATLVLANARDSWLGASIIGQQFIADWVYNVGGYVPHVEQSGRMDPAGFVQKANVIALLKHVPRESRADVANRVGAMLAATRAAVDPAMWPYMVGDVVRAKNVAKAMGKNPALTMDELAGEVAADRLAQVPDPEYAAATAVLGGEPGTSGFPVQVQPKGKDKTRRQWVSMFTPNEQVDKRQREELLDQWISASHAQKKHADGGSVSSVGAHSMNSATSMAGSERIEVYASQSTTFAEAAARANAAEKARDAARAEAAQQRLMARIAEEEEDDAAVLAPPPQIQPKLLIREPPVEVAAIAAGEIEEAQKSAVAMGLTPDFELASTHTRLAHGVAPLDAGEGAVHVVEMPSQVESTQQPMTSNTGIGAAIGQAVTKMGFRRPANSSKQ